MRHETNYKEIRAVYTDRSPSPLTSKQAFEIAKRAAIAREGFTDEPRVPFKTTKGVTGTASRINNGGWRVTARAMIHTNGRDGASAYIDVPGAVITINAKGELISYTRHSIQEFFEAEQAIAPNRS